MSDTPVADAAVAGPAEIRELSPQLASQVAAGEVIERPASVVKELLENCLDAGAKRISVHIESGGVALIKVNDDGHGIAATQLSLALARHATSKLRDSRQLAAIASLGFRGEALASIASVAELCIESAIAGDSGWQLCGNGRPQPVAHPTGTTVSVRDLFFNVPARRKFLRTERTEFLQIEDVVRRIALSRFDVAFALFHGERQALRVVPRAPGLTGARRVADVCGNAFLEQAIPVDTEHQGVRLWGWLGLPAAHRAQADIQYFFINGRSIRDKVINHALRQAYQERQPPGRYPGWVLFLDIDPVRVDVNVHPTKHEVRFAEPRAIHDFLGLAVSQALSPDAPPVPAAAQVYQSQPPASAGVRVGEAGAAYGGFVASAVSKAAPAAAETVLQGPLLYARYALVSHHEQLCLLDLRAAKRRLTLSALRADEVPSRPLLVPVAARMPASLLQAHGDVILRLGFQLAAASEVAVMVREVPVALATVDAAALVGVLAASLQDGADIATALAGWSASVLRFEASSAQTLIRQLDAAAYAEASVCQPLSEARLQELMDA